MAKSLLLVHGAGSGPWVFHGWHASFSGLHVATVDLHEGLEIGVASMDDYAHRVVAASKKLRKPVTLCGWSMGGLVALMAAEVTHCEALVLIEPRPPGEVQGLSPDAPLEEGTFDPEVVYGTFPTGVPSRPESSRARAERKRGISVPRVSCRTLVISGDEFVDERGVPVAALYDAEHAQFPGFDHWDLVRSRGAREDRYLPATLGRHIRPSILRLCRSTTAWSSEQGGIGAGGDTFPT